MNLTRDDLKDEFKSLSLEEVKMHHMKKYAEELHLIRIADSIVFTDKDGRYKYLKYRYGRTEEIFNP